MDATGHCLCGAFVVAGIGSLTGAQLRLAPAEAETQVEGPLEVPLMNTPGRRLSRAVDAGTGYRELVVRRLET